MIRFLDQAMAGPAESADPGIGAVQQGIIHTHEYYSKFRQHNGRVVKTGTVPSTAPRSTLKPRGF